MGSISGTLPTLMKLPIFLLAAALALASASDGTAQAVYFNQSVCAAPRSGLPVVWAGKPYRPIARGWSGGYRLPVPRVAYGAPGVRYPCYTAPVVNYYQGRSLGPAGVSFGVARRARVNFRRAATVIVPDPVVFRSPGVSAPWRVPRPVR